MLDQCDDGNLAMRQLIFATARHGHQSVLDHATEVDGESHRCRLFVSHPFCETLAQRYFYGDFPGSQMCIIDPRWWRALLHMLFLGQLPWCHVRSLQRNKSNGQRDLFKSDRRNEEGGEDDDECMSIASEARPRIWKPGSAVANFIQIPYVRFITHNTIALVYTFWLALNLCGWPWQAASWMFRAGSIGADEIQIWEIVNWVWTGFKIAEELEQLLAVPGGLEDYFSNVYNWIDVLTYSSIMLVIAIKLALKYSVPYYMAVTTFAAWKLLVSGDPPAGDPVYWTAFFVNCIQLLYAFAVLLLTVRFINAMKMDRSVGCLIIIVGQMVPSIISWIGLMMCWTLGFSAFFAIVMPGYVVYGDLITLPGYQPFWGLLGEFDLEAISTYVPAGGADPNSTLVPVAMYAYIFVATIVLINLLIAQMGDVYGEVKEKAREFWAFEFLSDTVREYKDYRKLPAPFNIFRFLKWILDKLMCKPPPQETKGFSWDGADYSRHSKEQILEDQRARGYAHHKRYQAILCAKYMASLAEAKQAGLEAQISDLRTDLTNSLSANDEQLVTVVSMLAKLTSRINQHKLPPNTKSSRPAIEMVAPPSLASISAPAKQHLVPAKPLPPVARSVDVPLKKAVTGINPPPSRRMGLQPPSLKIAPISPPRPDNGFIEGGLPAKAAAAESTPTAALLLSAERPHRLAPSLPPAAPPPTGWPPGMAPEPETPPEGWPEGWPPGAEPSQAAAAPASHVAAAPASHVATAAPAAAASAASAAAATPAPLATAAHLATAAPPLGQAEAATPAPLATAAPLPGPAEAATKVQAAQRGKAVRKEQKKDLPMGDLPKGDQPKGDQPKGDLPKGDLLKGDLLKGDLPKGDQPKGDLPEGDLPEGDLPKGDLPKGDLSKGDLPKGAVGTNTEPKPEAPSSEAASSEAPQLGDSGTEQEPSSKGPRVPYP